MLSSLLLELIGKVAVLMLDTVAMLLGIGLLTPPLPVILNWVELTHYNLLKLSLYQKIVTPTTKTALLLPFSALIASEMIYGAEKPLVSSSEANLYLFKLLFCG